MELETFFTVDTHVEVFLLSCLVGIILGLIYDIFRIFRIIVPHTDVLTAIEDIILLSAYGVFIMCFAFSLMRGQLRFFFIIGNFLGFTVWFLTLGSIINKVAYRLKKYILKFINIVTYPLKKIIPLFNSLKKFLKNTKKTLD